MGFREFDDHEIHQSLAAERVVRLAFTAPGETYIVPVFFAWHDGAVCGLTTPGRKTSLAAANPHVAFQLDSSATSGPWVWSSVSGEGQWEVVRDPAQVGAIAAHIQLKLSDAPEWAGRELQARFAELGMVAWRIRPTRISGRAHGPG